MAWGHEETLSFFLTELQKPVKKIAINLHNQGSTFHVNYERKRQ